MVSNVAQVRPAPLACTECRAKHLKCDGGTPRCDRCVAEGLRCVFKPSRRGYGRKNAIGRYPSYHDSPQEQRPITPVTGSPVNSHYTNAPSGPSTVNDNASTYRGGQTTIVPLQLDTPQTPFASRPSSSSEDPQVIDSELEIKSYYVHFHPAHPLLVPQSFFARREYPDYLQWTVCLIGRQYIARDSGSPQIDGVVMRMLAPERDEMTVCRVQALVIFAIALHSLSRSQEALECVQRAIGIANGLGLSRPDFASSNAARGSVEEESIRRTWWELYIVEAYLAALHRHLSLLSAEQGPYPPLPSWEASYNAGTCDTNPASLTLFENRAFMQEHETIKFSTYCYRLEAARILHRVSNLFSNEHAKSDGTQAADNAIASWKYYLPDRRSNDSEDLTDVDPLLFQAQFLVHSASILLHFPRSDLPSTVPTAADIACVRSHAQRVPGSLQHSMKAIAASKEIANLAAGLSSTDTCSPLFICALILACVVQLAASTTHRGKHAGAYLPQHRDCIVLLLGVLTEVGGRWTVARNALQPLRLVAGTIFGAPQTHDSVMPSSGVASEGIADTSDVLAGVPWFDLFSVDDLMADFMDSTSGSNL